MTVNESKEQDSIVVVRCQLGEHQAWETLVTRWHPRLWRFVFGMLSERVYAEDVIQTIWLRVVRSLARLRDPEKLSGWIYGIARATIADRLREQYQHPAPDEFVDYVDFDSGANSIDVSDSLQAGLARLHPSEREVLVLFYLEERSLSEVAEICHIPSGTVKSRLHRARRMIRETLKDERDEHDME